MSIAKLRSRLAKAKTNLRKVLRTPKYGVVQAHFARRRVRAAATLLHEAKRRHGHAVHHREQR